MGLSFAVVTAVARDDLADGGAAAFAATIEAIRRRTPGHARSRCSSPTARATPTRSATIFAARPDVLNHNIETVARLQRAVRPSAAYARSLSVLARAKAAGLTTKSGIIVGMGETDDEVVARPWPTSPASASTSSPSASTCGPTTHHLPGRPVGARPRSSTRYAAAGEALGIGHVESSPLTRSSYHAKQAAGADASRGPLSAVGRRLTSRAPVIRPRHRRVARRACRS